MQILFYPTAIGSEPPNPSYSSYPHWARVMQGHAGANMVRRPVPAAPLAITAVCQLMKRAVHIN